MKKISVLLFSVLCLTSYALASGNNYYQEQQKNSSRYDYIYKNPPRQSLGAYGHFMYMSSGVRYTHSPSRLKGSRHQTRIDAYNRMYGN